MCNGDSKCKPCQERLQNYLDMDDLFEVGFLEDIDINEQIVSTLEISADVGGSHSISDDLVTWLARQAKMEDKIAKPENFGMAQALLGNVVEVLAENKLSGAPSRIVKSYGVGLQKGGFSKIFDYLKAKDPFKLNGIGAMFPNNHYEDYHQDAIANILDEGGYDDFEAGMGMGAAQPVHEIYDDLTA